MPYLQSPDWGWLILAAMFFSAVAAGAYFAYSSIELSGNADHRQALWRLGLLPLPLLMVVPLLLTIDLGQPLRFLNLLIRSPSATERPGPLMFNPLSPMDWGSWGLFLFGAFALVAFLDSATHLWRWRFGFLEPLAHNIVWGIIGGAVSLLPRAFPGPLPSAIPPPARGRPRHAAGACFTMRARAAV